MDWGQWQLSTMMSGSMVKPKLQRMRALKHVEYDPLHLQNNSNMTSEHEDHCANGASTKTKTLGGKPGVVPPPRMHNWNGDKSFRVRGPSDEADLDMFCSYLGISGVANLGISVSDWERRKPVSSPFSPPTDQLASSPTIQPISPPTATGSLSPVDQRPRLTIDPPYDSPVDPLEGLGRRSRLPDILGNEQRPQYGSRPQKDSPAALRAERPRMLSERGYTPVTERSLKTAESFPGVLERSTLLPVTTGAVQSTHQPEGGTSALNESAFSRKLLRTEAELRRWHSEPPEKWAEVSPSSSESTPVASMVGEPKASDRRAGIAFKEPLAKQGDGDSVRHASNKEHRHSSSLAPLQWHGKHAESSSGQQEPPQEHVANEAEEGPIVVDPVVPVPPEDRAAEQTASVVPAENSATEQTACDEFVSDASNEPSWNSWKKGDLLGSGSFGTVYEAVGDNGCFFAVKEVSLSEQDSQAKQAIMQLEQEITLLRKFRHDNIVQYLGTQMEVDKLYIFLELVSKGSLASVYRKYGVMFPDQVRRYTQQILRGLKYLHDRHIVHRDIKCANILVDVNGVVKLADFGMAKQVAKLDMLKSCKGSAYWMAPEVIDPKKSYNVAADIWSLGCTVLEMATGSPPFGDLEWLRVLWKVGHGEVPPIPETLPPAMIDFIAGCLEVNVMKRPTVDMLLVHPFVTGMPELGLPRFVGPAGLPNIEEHTSLELTFGTETVEEESTNSVVVVRRQVHSMRTRRSEFSMSSLPEEPHQSHS